jgi:mycofactocin system creatininase family protein
MGRIVVTMTTELAALSWTTLTARRPVAGVLAVPVGSTEQHGPHLPLSTDTDVATWLARALARKRPDVLVAPALPYGSSGEHQDFAGTLSIGQEATRLLLVELVRSARRTFRRVLLVVGHGGNAEPVNQAVAQLRSEGHDVLAWAPSFPGDAHAGRTETSLMLSIAPYLVRTHRAEAGATEPLPALLPTLRAEGVRAVSPNGVLGDPTGAAAAEGRQLLARAADELVAVLNHWAGEPR